MSCAAGALTHRHLRQRLHEENERSDAAITTLTQSTERFVESMRTHQQMQASLSESNTLLSQLFVRVNLEDLIFYAALGFYLAVVLYIVLARTLFHFLW